MWYMLYGDCPLGGLKGLQVLYYGYGMALFYWLVLSKDHGSWCHIVTQGVNGTCYL